MIRTFDELVTVAGHNFWTLVKDKVNERVCVYDGDKLIGTWNAWSQQIQMTAERSHTIGINVTHRKSDETWHINVYVDGKAERSYKFGDPITLAQAMQFVAGEIRLEGNKWDIDSVSPRI
jgi:hypothetical protein